jgi:hypothetical protein
MKNRFSQPAIRLLEANYRGAYGRLLDIAIDRNNSEVMQMSATTEAIMLAAKLAAARKAILRSSGQE